MGMAVTQSQDIQSDLYQYAYGHGCHRVKTFSLCSISVLWAWLSHRVKTFSLCSISVLWAWLSQSQDIQFVFYQCLTGMAVTQSRHSVCVLSVSYGHGCHTESRYSVCFLSVCLWAWLSQSQDIQFVFYQCLMGMAVTQSQDIQSDFYQCAYGHGCHRVKTFSSCSISVLWAWLSHRVKIFSLISISVLWAWLSQSQDIQFMFYQCLVGMAVTESRHSVHVLSVSCGHGCHISSQESSPSSISVIMGMVVT